MYWRTTRSLPTFIGKVEKILSRVLQPSMVLANSYAAKLDKQFPCPRLDVSSGFLAQSALQHPRRRCTHCLFRFGHPAFLQHICTSRHTNSPRVHPLHTEASSRGETPRLHKQNKNQPLALKLHAYFFPNKLQLRGHRESQLCGACRGLSFTSSLVAVSHCRSQKFGSVSGP